MRRLVIGTAGHIDHGKTALTRALTGIDTDRLPAEKQQGISIELGFAPWRLNDELCADLIDVPGHEKFIKTMTAGVAAIDLALFVVDANEGVMPQTREHLAILNLLGIKNCIFVLSKCDIASPEQIANTHAGLDALLEGSVFAAAPRLEASVYDPESLSAIKEAVIKLAAEIKPQHNEKLTRLPVDRSFTIKGFGTVVTGTLWSGSLKTDQQVEILPAGITARIRGLEVNGQPVNECAEKERVAVNLSGVELSELPRGSWITIANTLPEELVLPVKLTLLPEVKKIKHNTRLRLRFGAKESYGKVLYKNDEARLKCEEPLFALPNDVIILASLSPSVTLGKAEVLPPKAEAPAPDNAEKLQEINELLAEYHKAFPLRPGMPLAEFRQKMGKNLSMEEQQNFIDRGDIQSRNNCLALTGFKPQANAEEQKLLDFIIKQLEKDLLAPPAWSDISKKLPKIQGKELLNFLLNEGLCVRLDAEIILTKKALNKAKSIVVQKLRQKGEISLADARDILKTSRKFALAILEHFDKTGLTERRGEARVLKKEEK